MRSKNSTHARKNGKAVLVPVVWVNAVVDAWQAADVSPVWTQKNPWDEPPYVEIDVQLDMSAEVLPAPLRVARRSSAVRRPIKLKVYAGSAVPRVSYFSGIEWAGGSFDTRTMVMELPKGRPEEHIRTVVNHELVHLLQGVGIRARIPYAMGAEHVRPKALYTMSEAMGLRRSGLSPGEKHGEPEAYANTAFLEVRRALASTYHDIIQFGPNLPETSQLAVLYRSPQARQELFWSALNDAMGTIADNFTVGPVWDYVFKKVADSALVIRDRLEGYLKEDQRRRERESERVLSDHLD